jgi:hypothetical protein
MFAAESHSTYQIESSAPRITITSKEKKLVENGQDSPRFTSNTYALDFEGITAATVTFKSI